MATALSKGRLPELAPLLAGATPARGQTKADQIAAARAIFGDRVQTKADRGRR